MSQLAQIVAFRRAVLPRCSRTSLGWTPDIFHDPFARQRILRCPCSEKNLKSLTHRNLSDLLSKSTAAAQPGPPKILYFFIAFCWFESPRAWGWGQAVKARIEDMLAEEATIDGLEHVECKVFK